VRQRPFGLDDSTLRPLIRNHGAAYLDVLRHFDASAASESLPSDAVLLAQVRHAVRQEMAQKLGDVVFRRTDLGSAGRPGDDTLRRCAATMGAELRWGPGTLQRELSDVAATFEAHLPPGLRTSDAGPRPGTPR